MPERDGKREAERERERGEEEKSVRLSNASPPLHFETFPNRPRATRPFHAPFMQNAARGHGMADIVTQNDLAELRDTA